MCMHVNCTLFTFWIWYICPLFLQAESLTMCCCLLCFDLDLTHVRTWKTSEVNFKKQVLTICKLNTLDTILLVFFLNSCKAYANWCHPTLVRLPCCVNFKFSTFNVRCFFFVFPDIPLCKSVLVWLWFLFIVLCDWSLFHISCKICFQFARISTKMGAALQFVFGRVKWPFYSRRLKLAVYVGYAIVEFIIHLGLNHRTRHGCLYFSGFISGFNWRYFL